MIDIRFDFDTTLLKKGNHDGLSEEQCIMLVRTWAQISGRKEPFATLRRFACLVRINRSALHIEHLKQDYGDIGHLKIGLSAKIWPRIFRFGRHEMVINQLK